MQIEQDYRSMELPDPVNLLYELTTSALTEKSLL